MAQLLIDELEYRERVINDLLNHQYPEISRTTS